MKIYLIILMTSTFFWGNTQEISYRYLLGFEKNQNIEIKKTDLIENVTYLGSVKDKDSVIIFHIITIFSIVNNGVQKHGFSIVKYLNTNYDTIERYELGLPDELPFQLIDNKLYFNYTDAKGNHKVFGYFIGITVPKLMCVSPFNCY